MNHDLEAILNFFRTHTEEEIARFDIKDLWEKEIVDETVKKMKQEVSSYYKIGNMTPLKKMCCYKIAADALGIDCDVSLFSVVIYRLLFPVSGTYIEPQKRTRNEKYQLTGLDFICVGDTMNSYATVTRNYIRSHYQNETMYMPNRKGHLKWEYRNVSYQNPFEVAILDHYKDIERLLPNYIKDFLEVVHTIGNILPVPKDCFNVPRNKFTNDYWDITLEGIYQNKFEKIIGPSTRARWSRKENVEASRKWFQNYGNWRAFVEKTYMQDFVDENLVPILLCKKKKNRHSVWIPTDEIEYENFYTNVKAMISKRGKFLASKLKEIVSHNTNEEIIEQYFKDSYFHFKK